MHIAKDTHGVEVTKSCPAGWQTLGPSQVWPHLRGIWLVDVTLQPRLKSSRGAVYSSSGCCPPPSHCKFSVSPKKFHCWQLQLHRGLCILLLLFSLIKLRSGRCTPESTNSPHQSLNRCAPIRSGLRRPPSDCAGFILKLSPGLRGLPCGAMLPTTAMEVLQAGMSSITRVMTRLRTWPVQ